VGRVTGEADYDRLRLTQWLAGRARGTGMPRRGPHHAPRAVRPGSIVKPLPAGLFFDHETNAEMRWEAMRGQGYLVPADRFFVRNHTRTPLIDSGTWRLRVFGTGLRAAPSLARAVTFSYQDLLDLPAESVTAAIECAGNGRKFFTSQQNEAVPGTPWMLGAIGVARWRGVRLATVLERAGLTREAVDILPQGLDPHYFEGGADLGPVRRPLPVAKALSDALLAYEMNGQPLPPDHGFPLRLVVPSWAGVASIKWVGQIEVSRTPLVSPWNTQLYRLFGGGYPDAGAPITTQIVKSAFELAWDAQLQAGREHMLQGRSWAGSGSIRQVEVSTDGGRSWRLARPIDPGLDQVWRRWQLPWQPVHPGPGTLQARATDVGGTTQPATTPYNTMGYLFGGVVAHPVTVI
jgi:DMSO/TMAO reductase YedYZ molybdopterin-dependent catalytic subunit